MSIRVGDIVRTPPNGVYGNALAIVEKLQGTGNSQAITVHSERAQLMYERQQLINNRVAVIKIVRSYSSLGGNHFAACLVDDGHGKPIEIHVCVGNRSDGRETRALEIKKLVFVELLKREYKL